jgi:hypothetical protein
MARHSITLPHLRPGCVPTYQIVQLSFSACLSKLRGISEHPACSGLTVGCSKQLTCFVCACTGAQDQQAALQQKQKQVEESKQELAQLKEVAEPDRV